MIWGECAPWQACRGPTGTEVRVRGGIWTPACTVWTWCDLASRASATVDAWCLKQMRDAEAAELSLAAARRTHCNFSCRRTGSEESVTVVDSGVDEGPDKRVCSFRSSVYVGWCVAGVAGKSRCQPRCWRGSEASCCCRSGHRDRERTRPDGHQLHRRSLWDRRSAANGDLFPAKSTRSWMGWAVVDLSSSMTRQTWHSSTSEPSGQRRRFEPSIRISVGRRRTRAPVSQGRFLKVGKVRTRAIRPVRWLRLRWCWRTWLWCWRTWLWC